MSIMDQNKEPIATTSVGEHDSAAAGHIKKRKQVEVTPGNVHNLGLPFVLQNQSGFNFWDIKSGDHFIELEGQHYGWDSSTVQVTAMGPGHGPPMHTHPVEEIFVLVEGEAAFAVGEEIFHLKAPAVMRVPPHTPHSPATLGAGRNVMVDFFPSSQPGAAHSDATDPFSHVKTGGGNERRAMIENFKKILADFDADQDGKLSRDEAPIMFRDSFGRYDSDGDGFVTMEDAQGWD
jgi:mannose-6-phosphate isomerase-like protein (cupin superfamily)